MSEVTSEEPSAFRLIATLAIAGLVAGLALVGIYEVTLPTIKANKAAALREAVLQVVPGATTMQPLEPSGGSLALAPEGAEDVVYGAYDDQGTFKGYAVPAAGSGFQDTIAIIYGFDPTNKHIVGFRVLESHETPGLGDKIYKDPAFGANFDDLAVEPEVVGVKKGQKARPNEIDCITGATISSKSVVKIINASTGHWLGQLPPAGSEPKLQAAPSGAKADGGAEKGKEGSP